MDGFIHAHPLLTIAVFTFVVVGVFVWALFDGSDSQTAQLQEGGDWQWPRREEA